MAKTYGLIARFETAQDIFHAAETVRDAGYKKWDCLTPFPIHGLNEAMGVRRSLVGAFTLVGGTIGFTTGWTIAYLMGMFDYPLIVGGKPYFDFVFPFPVAYELTILLSAFGTLGGMFITNALPMHWHPVFNHPDFHRFTDDQFALVIEAKDPLFAEAATRQFLEELKPLDVVAVTDAEETEVAPA